MHHTARALAVVLGLVSAGTLAACGATSPTLAPSVEALPTIAPVIPTPVGGGTRPPEGSGTPVVVAKDIAIVPGKIGVPANAPFTLILATATPASPTASRSRMASARPS